MGKIADEMIRLSQEIRAGHVERRAYVTDLRNSVAKLRVELRRAHAQMATASLAARREVVNDLLTARRAWTGLGPGTGPVGERVVAQVQAEAVAPVPVAPAPIVAGIPDRGGRRKKSTR